jgi:hypothetical protein
MNRTLILLGVSIVTLGTMLSRAEARLVRYEINGKQYSYSTNNHAQTAEARKRIAAAKAAEAAKAKADAEKAGNPLAAAFGSTAQKEAKEAEARLQQILSGPTQYMAASQLARDAVSGAGRKTQDQQPRQASVAKPPQRSNAVVREPVKPIDVLAPAAPLIAEPVDLQGQAKVKTVSFDIESGIRTTIMTDGSIEEEPFDSSVLSILAPEPERMNSLAAFVNQLRKAAPEDATGSIRTSAAEPNDTSLIRRR